MIELTDEFILKIDDLLDDWAIPGAEIGLAALKNKEMPQEYINDNIFIEYYNGIKDGEDPFQMRRNCIPKYIRREIKKLKITE